MHCMVVVFFLQITAELASDSKDFSSALAKTRLAELTHPLQVVPIERVARPEVGRTLTSKSNAAMSRRDDADDVSHLPPPSPRSSRRVASLSPRGGRTAQLTTGDSSGPYEVRALPVAIFSVRIVFRYIFEWCF